MQFNRDRWRIYADKLHLDIVKQVIKYLIVAAILAICTVVLLALKNFTGGEPNPIIYIIMGLVVIGGLDAIHKTFYFLPNRKKTNKTQTETNAAQQD